MVSYVEWVREHMFSWVVRLQGQITGAGIQNGLCKKRQKQTCRLQTNAGACAKKAGAEANWGRQCSSVQTRQGSSGRRRQVGFSASAQCCCTQKLASKWMFASGAAISYAWAGFFGV